MQSPFALTPRETEILALIAEGLTSRAVAAKLSIAVSTVDTHAKTIRRKTGAAKTIVAARRIERFIGETDL
jgi:two-component system, NarL family, nitrate/nitrite response regulator NarL